MNALQRCLPPDINRFVNESPKALDTTYELVLKGINEVQRDSAHRLLRYLTAAARPLRVEEIAELLGFGRPALEGLLNQRTGDGTTMRKPYSRPVPV